LKCPNCGMDNADDKKFCGECGAKLEVSSTRKCINCGRGIQFDAMICQYCGYDYRQKFRGGAERSISKYLSYGLIVVGVWVLAIAGMNFFGFYYGGLWNFLDIGVGVVLVILGIRALAPRE